MVLAGTVCLRGSLAVTAARLQHAGPRRVRCASPPDCTPLEHSLTWAGLPWWQHATCVHRQRNGCMARMCLQVRPS